MNRFSLMMSAAFVTALAMPAFAQVSPSADPGQTSDRPANPTNTTGSAASGGISNEEIVVTARRVAEKLQDIPLAVSAVSGAQLQRTAVRELKDLAATVPNLQANGANNGGSAIAFTIRGQGQAVTGQLYVDPAVGVYVDGLNIPRNVGLRTGLIDIQRVEILRGPQGTLYGRNTTGGAVSIVTNDPKDEFGGSMQASYGNYNAWNLTGVLNLPISDGIALRLSGQHGEHGAYGHQVTTGADLAWENLTYLRAKLKIDKGPLKISITGDYNRYASGGPIFHLVGLTPANPTETRYSGRVCVPAAGLVGAAAAEIGPACGAGATAGNYYGVAGGTSASIARLYLGLPNTAAGLDAASAYLQQFVRRGAGAAQGIGFYDTFGTSSSQLAGLNLTRNRGNSTGASVVANVDYELSDHLTARSISGWRRYDKYDSYDFDSTPLPLFETNNTAPFANFYSEEAQLLGNFHHFNFVFGGFYSYERGLDYVPSIALQAPGTSAFGIADGLTTNISKAVFGQGTYNFTDKLSVTLGARYTQETRKIRNRNRNSANACLIPVSLLNDPNGPITTLANGTTGPCGAFISNKYSDPSWLASLNYKLTPDVLAYVKFSRGFRGGGQQGRANTPTVTSSFVGFRPETVTEYEGGLKSELFDRHARLNLAVYYDDYQDAQRTVTLINALGQAYSLVNNAAKARLWGVEGEASVRPIDNVELNGTLGYLNAKYKQFSDINLGDRTGEPFPSPKWNYTIGGRYDVPTGFGRAFANLQWVYQSSINIQPQGLVRYENLQPGYGLLNGSAGVHFDKAGIDVSVFGRNLLAKHYYVAGISLESVGLNTLSVGDPRTFGIQITKKFGSER